VSRNTVKRYTEPGSWSGYRRGRRSRKLGRLEDWLKERFSRHRGDAKVVRQDLWRERGVRVSLRTVERAVAHFAPGDFGRGARDGPLRDAAWPPATVETRTTRASRSASPSEAASSCVTTSHSSLTMR
jgi:hypothetical protein